MNKELENEVGKMKKRRKNASRSKRVISVVALITIICTVAVMTFPAFTLTRGIICGMEEHTHTDECYSEIEIEEATELICGLEAHVHDETCYDEEGNIVCSLDEHEHTEECYEIIPAHMETVLSCEKPEHVHTDACYDAPVEENPVFCGYAGHVHNDSCYVDGELLCTLPEHEHTAQCYSDPTADLDSAANWEKDFARYHRTWDLRADTLAIAETQLGINESTKNYIVTEEGVQKGYSRYGAWYGDPYGDWCAMFCSFCLSYAGVDTEQFPLESNCQRWIEKLSSEEIDRYRPADDYPPKPGDLIFFDYDEYETEEEREANHVGLVSEVLYPQNDEETLRVKTIEGNTAEGVSYNTYEITDLTIMGYGELPETSKPLKRAAMKAATITIDAWQEVTEIDDINAKYLIVSDDGYALGVRYASRTYSVTSTELNLMELTNHRGYYTADVGDAFQWTFSATGNSSKQTNVGYSEYGLRLSNSTIINTVENESTNTLTYTDGYWRISYRGSRNTYYLNCDSDGSFSRSTDTTNANMRIFKQVEIVEGGGGGEVNPGSIEKPTYPDYIVPSDAKTGTTSIGEVEGTYYSDGGTSQLESHFDGNPSDDGKVLSDKSVIYGDDDYDAFDSYAPNTFGVELSALGQKYAISEEFQVKTPLDVVFVLDTSGSMINTTYNGVTSANIMVEALNKIMKRIMDDNEDNRVGVVCYSGSATKLLDLGRYTAPNDKYFPEGQCTSNTYQLAPSTSIKRTDGTLYRGTFNKGWYGTYTQDGIATGAQIFLDTEDTSVTRTLEKETEMGTIRVTYTAQRRPLVILLSDGEPTYCTSDYADVLNSKNMYGNGNTGYNNNGNIINDGNNSYSNNKGILGYYTILSAQAYKDKIASHYNTDAYFYTIGIGMDPTSHDSYEQSVAGDDYKRAVLNPTADNINALTKCTSATCLSPLVTSNSQKDISGKIDQTCRMLHRLLNDNQSGTTVNIGNHNQSTANNYGCRLAPTTSSVPIKTNPYKTSGYSYANGAYFTANNSVETLTTAFTEAISFVDMFPVYGFILRSNTPYEITDNIGEGMEIKGAPVLRYNGVNYPTKLVTTLGDTAYYVAPYTAATTDGSGQVADLSLIEIRVTTDENGNQSVTLHIPDSELPTYTPNLKNDGSAYFYYEQLPVRLIYQVGLTDESVAEVEELAKTGGTKTFYTNCWGEDDYAFSSFAPTLKNPYYQNEDYDKTPLPKNENLTQTYDKAWEFTEDSDPEFVSEILGNNGKLVFHAEPVAADIKLVKVSEGDLPILTDTAEFTLYTDEKLTDIFGVYTTTRAEVEITDLPVGATYYLKETKSPRGFNLMPGVKEITIDADGKVVGHEDDEYLLFNDDNTIHVINYSGYALPETGGMGLTPIYMIGAAILLPVIIYATVPKRRRERSVK